MTYLDLTTIKTHLNIDASFTDDDEYITSLGNAAEDVVAQYINRDLCDLEDANKKIPQSLIQAMLLWIGTQYCVRESVTSSVMTPVSHSFDLLCDLYRKYN